MTLDHTVATMTLDRTVDTMTLDSILPSMLLLQFDSLYCTADVIARVVA
jgi:hypothetical protein